MRLMDSWDGREENKQGWKLSMRIHAFEPIVAWASLASKKWKRGDILMDKPCLRCIPLHMRYVPLNLYLSRDVCCVRNYVPPSHSAATASCSLQKGITYQKIHFVTPAQPYTSRYCVLSMEYPAGAEVAAPPTGPPVSLHY